MKTKECLECL